MCLHQFNVSKTESSEGGSTSSFQNGGSQKKVLQTNQFLQLFTYNILKNLSFIARKATKDQLLSDTIILLI